MATIPTIHSWTTGEVATAANLNNDTVSTWNFLSAKPLCVLRQTTIQTVPTATWTGINFDTEDLDRDNGHSTVSNTSRYVAQTAGWYLVTGQVNMSSNTTSARFACFQINGTNRYAKDGRTPLTGGSNTPATTNTVLYLNVGDYAEFAAWQGTGSGLSTQVNDDGNPRFTLLWVST